jgi:hypothetical protein
MVSLRHAVACCAAIVGVLAAVPLGCRQVLGIEARGSDDLTCELYCNSIATACTGADDDLQYGSTAACLALCATFPVGTLQDNGPNSLGCRIRQVGLVGGAEGVCAGAGPGGDGYCGSNCQSFCHSAVQICPMDFASEADCLAVCANIPDCSPPDPPYFVDPNMTTLPNVNSIQCRLYHLTSASLDPVTHCPHVLGIGYCSPSNPACEGPDAQLDGGAPDAGSDGG